MARVLASPTSPAPVASYAPTPISLDRIVTEVSAHWGGAAAATSAALTLCG